MPPGPSTETVADASPPADAGITDGTTAMSSGEAGPLDAPAVDAGVDASAPSERPVTSCPEAERETMYEADEFQGIEGPPTGPYAVKVETDERLPGYTIFRPTSAPEAKFPIIAWANGGCYRNGTFFGEFLIELASHGFIVLGDGPPLGHDFVATFLNGAEAREESDATAQREMVDWAVAENARECSPLFGKIDSEKIAVMGQSCGGLMSIHALADDPRVSTAVMWNSGLFERDASIYDALHGSLAIIDGGPDDIAYENGKADFEAIDNIPIMFANNSDYGHGGTYWDENGGEQAQVGLAWLRWQLFADEGPTGRGMFLGAGCGLCDKPQWSVETRMLD